MSRLSLRCLLRMSSFNFLFHVLLYILWFFQYKNTIFNEIPSDGPQRKQICSSSTCNASGCRRERVEKGGKSVQVDGEVQWRSCLGWWFQRPRFEGTDECHTFQSLIESTAKNSHCNVSTGKLATRYMFCLS